MTMTVVAVVCAGFVSCSSDDDGGNSGNGTSLNGGNGLTTPKYESVSALYTITEDAEDAPSIHSIELTASGDYVVILNEEVSSPDYPYYAKKRGNYMKFIPKNLLTRVTIDNIIHGKYTQIDDTTFDLEGWGIVKITGSANNAVSITVTPKDSNEPYTVTAARKNQLPESSLTSKICRTWDISSLRITIEFLGREMFNKEYTMAQYPTQVVADLVEWAKKMEEMYGEDDDDEYDDDDYDDDFDFDMDESTKPEQIIFTKAGTYMVKYANETLALSTWSWKDESKGILTYSWNYDSMDYWYEAGNVTVAFRGDQLAISESSYDKEHYYDDNDYYDDEDYDEPNFIITYYMNEVK